jgi:hypothetical protein
MRRLLVLCSAVGLLCGVVGCQSCCGLGSGTGHAHGRCDCDDGPQWGCCFETYLHGSDHGAPVGVVAPAAAVSAESMPKDNAK